MLLPSVFGEDLFDETFPFAGMTDRHGHDKLFGNRAGRLMKTDVRETEGSYELDVDLPGFKKDEIHLALDHGYLTISAEKSLEKDKENEKGKMLRQERYSGVMQRSFYIGDHLTEEDVKASYESGVLHIKFPKKEALKAPEKKTILIEG